MHHSPIHPVPKSMFSLRQKLHLINNQFNGFTLFGTRHIFSASFFIITVHLYTWRIRFPFIPHGEKWTNDRICLCTVAMRLMHTTYNALKKKLEEKDVVVHAEWHRIRLRFQYATNKPFILKSNWHCYRYRNTQNYKHIVAFRLIKSLALRFAKQKLLLFPFYLFFSVKNLDFILTV